MRIPRLAGTLTLTVVLAPLIVHGAEPAGLAGKWSAEFQTPVGQVRYVFELALSGSKITGKASFDRVAMGQKGQADLLEGKLTGDQVFFVEMIDMGTPVRVEYKGTWKMDEIAFTRKVGELGTQQFVARRVQAP